MKRKGTEARDTKGGARCSVHMGQGGSVVVLLQGGTRGEYPEGHDRARMPHVGRGVAAGSLAIKARLTELGA